jgi:hypothetical protein
MYPDSVLTVFHESAQVPGPLEAGDDRVVQAFLGGNGEFTEASGLRYVIEQVQATWYGELAYRWQGQQLAACSATPQPPCVTATSHLGVLTVEGGSGQRGLTLRIRH